MTEILISFELMTMIYIIILIPLFVFLIVCAFRLARYTTDRYILNKLDDAMELSSNLLYENNRLLRLNLSKREKLNEQLKEEENARKNDD